MASADTNILLRWALGDLPEQTERATRLLEGSDEIEVADVAIIETIFVLEKVYKLERGIVVGYIRALMSLGRVNCNRSLFSRALPLYESHQQLSVIDCCLAVYAELNVAMPLYTFDKHLANKLSAANLLH
jgi:predicted nucleic-acid-binding protein